jgi:multidrug efflux pump subunit AcrA (membrane-fusion protein)
MSRSDWTVGLVFGVLTLLSACRADGPATPEPSEASVIGPAEHPVAGGSFALSEAAEARLGIETTSVSVATSRRTRAVGGFVINPIGGALSITAPLAGVVVAGDVELEAGATVEAGAVLLRLVPLAPVDRDLRAQAQRQLDSAEARLELTRARVERITALLDNKASSKRALEEASADMRVAEGDERAARARARALSRSPLAADVRLELVAPRAGLVRSINTAPGQVVAAGAPLIELADVALWLRVPVYAGDLDTLDLDAPVRVARLGHEWGELEATPVLAPPTADPLTNTIDRYYSLPAPSVLAPSLPAPSLPAPSVPVPALESTAPPADASVLRYPGERVRVELPFTDEVARTKLPASAVIVDSDGSTWVFECLAGEGPHRFIRRRVEVLRRNADELVLAQGPSVGTCVVQVGALELWGAEFGVTH